MLSGSRLVRGLIAGALFLLLIAPTALPDEGAVSEREIKTRLRKLKNTSNTWFATRKRFPSRCPLCGGTGYTVYHNRQGAHRRTCNQCKGKKLWVSDKHFITCYYKMRSPNFQDMRGVKERLDAVYQMARAGSPWPRRFDRVRIKRVEMIGPGHGIAWHLIDNDRVATESRWVFLTTRNKSKWYLWDQAADGAWPTERRRAEPQEAAGSGGWSALSGSEHKAVRGAVASAHLAWRGFEYLQRGGLLRVRLMPINEKDIAGAEGVIGPNAVRLAQALFATTERWGRVQLDWDVTWKDQFQHIVSRPLWISTLSRQKARDTDWASLPIDEQMRILDWSEPDHGGYERFPAPKKPKSDPKPKPEPKEPEEAETPPEEGGTPPEKAPPEQAPEPAAPTPPEAYDPPAEYEVPELSKRERAKGDKLVAEMQALYEKAAATYNEANQAKAQQAHDIYGEKLAEVRALLGSIQDIWNKELNKAMPGKSIEEREMAAEHHYGQILDDIYELKAIVRKLSSVR